MLEKQTSVTQQYKKVNLSANGDVISLGKKKQQSHDSGKADISGIFSEYVFAASAFIIVFLEAPMSSSMFLNKTFHFAALASAVAFWAFGVSSSFAAGASSNPSATVIVPIAIINSADLVFGKFAPGDGGDVTVATDGARTANGPILSSVGSTPAAAKFDVTGDNSATYGITWSGAAMLTDSVSSETMALSKISDFTAAGVTTGEVTSGELGAGGVQSIYLGGVLSVTSDQANGTYIGDVIATVEYN